MTLPGLVLPRSSRHLISGATNTGPTTFVRTLRGHLNNEFKSKVLGYSSGTRFARAYSAMATNSASSDDENMSGGQQDMRASQRAGAQTPNRAGYFPLGYKEGFSQWVRLTRIFNIEEY